MILGENINSVYSKGKEIQRVYSRGKLVWEKNVIDYNTTPFTVKAIDDKVNVSVYGNGSDPRIYYRYSINGGDWKQKYGEITINKNDTISITASKAYDVNIEGLSDVYGNVMSLIHGSDFIGKYSWYIYSQIYFGLFSHCDIRSAENLILPSILDGEYCCNQMFAYCEHLTIAPKILPATTLTKGCYAAMFFGCSSLISPPELPATVLAYDCYRQMFESCDSLIKAPELPATTLAQRCYYKMFESCDSLIKAPELPATTLINQCYQYMFCNCSLLNYIKCYAMNKDSDDRNAAAYMGNWAKDVSETGTFMYCRDSFIDVEISKGIDVVPEGWSLEYID